MARSTRRSFGRAAQFSAREAQVEASALILRGVTLDGPGTYTVAATDGKITRTVTWEVYGTGPRKARNAILFIGDGMSLGHRTAARILGKGITEGKYHGRLAMDSMPRMALVGTAGVDSVITDSANSASAYTTGHKSSVNALGVYADRTPDTLDDPRVETITSLVKRRLGMAVGVVTNTEVEDATPAAMVAHTRRRSDYDPIVGMFHESGVDVLMGGGSAHFLPKSTPGSRRGDDVDYVAKFRDAGYTIATTDKEMRAASLKPETRRLLGLFHPGNMDGVLDRRFLRKGTAERFPDQPDLVDMVRSALDVLSRHDGGFVLMVESGLIDKYSHPLDWERAVMDTIMLDRAVAVAVEFAARAERHADPRHRRSRARPVDRGHGRRQRAGRRHARQGRCLREGGVSQLSGAERRRLPRARRRVEAARDLLRGVPRLLRDVPARRSTGRSSPRSPGPTGATWPTTSTRTCPAPCSGPGTCRGAPTRGFTRVTT